jgi:hypothetical protein
MDISKITFSVNDYDQDGDISERGIYLHFDETRIRIGNLDCLNLFKNKIDRMIKEISENYPKRDTV